MPPRSLEAAAPSSSSSPEVGSGRRRRRAPLTVGLPVVLLAGFAALVAAVVLSLAVGAKPLAPAAVLDALAGRGSADAQYVMGLRLPRTAAAVLAGAALAVAGALVQGLTRNPLADPGLLGVNAGAAFAVALGVALLGLHDPWSVLWLALSGALVLSAAVIVVGGAVGGAGSAGRSGGSGAAGSVGGGSVGGGALRLVLAGVALGAALSGITTGLVLSDPDAFDAMRSWNAGSVLGRGWDVLGPALPFVLAGLLIAVVCARGLDALSLGDDLARSQGVRVARLRLAVVAAVTLLAGAATAVAGPLVFVGLVAPRVARWLVGPSLGRLLPTCLLLGPVLVLLADVIGRVLIAPAEVPVGVVIGVVGAPLLIAVARRSTR
ncbi:iron complex transport system permease protein [Quadrisphaera granulorum]|uniref:Iron complex transport system permease protein n=1 Tax=Quadrisphaera granulorum TaxID=317664 RepID=A0A316A930_9ACTN|nr:iron chelate uptake ABC transporter family permease subunit [Quadrisphaera granulorum]PWJ54201.1 iron complex transport system permease protein [Quadrisphaera granulorum]SZE96340.1 iron complex transport system permease protein [Quadrisphaera granulorum]